MTFDIAKPSVFERMLVQEERERYLEHRVGKVSMLQEEIAGLSSYLLGEECTDDIQRILAHDFTLPTPRKVTVRKTQSNRHRTLFVYPPRQRNLFSYLTWELYEYDDLYSGSLYSFRREKKLLTMFDQLRKTDIDRNLWVFKADVRDYFYSIKPRNLVPMLDRFMGERDPLLFSFLEHLLTNGAYLHGDEVVHGHMGGLPGVSMSALFGNVYLMELDDLLDSCAVFNVRYSDDVAAFMRTREEAEGAYAETKAVLDRLELEFNEDKTCLLAPGEILELLGIQLRDGNFDVADFTMRRVLYKFRLLARRLVLQEQRGELSRDKAARIMVDQVNRRFYNTIGQRHRLSWKTNFFTIVTRPDSFHAIDLAVQDLIRYVATGKRTDAKYRMSYQSMRDLGYRPLVHEYYAFRKEMYLYQQERHAKPVRQHP